MKVDAMISPKDAENGPSLLCRFVITAEAPRPDDADAEEGLRRVTQASLERAESFAVSFVGVLPLWSAPAHAERCARNMLQATLEYQVRARSIQRVVYCLFGKASYDLFDRVLKELQS